MHSSTLALALAATAAHGHFTLQTPQTIGYVDIDESKGPCGGFDIKSRDKVTEFPLGGHPIGVISTHPQSRWEVRAAPLNSTDRLELLLRPVVQTGLGAFCLPSVPGRADWVGLDGVVQVTQNAVDGTLYQCAAVKFVEGPAAAHIRDSCRNSTGTSATFASEGETGGGGGSPPPGHDGHGSSASRKAPGSVHVAAWGVILGLGAMCL